VTDWVTISSLATADARARLRGIRGPTDPEFDQLARLVTTRERIVIDVMYSDHDGGQRMIGRYSLRPVGDEGWLAAVARHGNVGQPDPRDPRG
jgi:hypothetical protein